MGDKKAVNTMVGALSLTSKEVSATPETSQRAFTICAQLTNGPETQEVVLWIQPPQVKGVVEEEERVEEVVWLSYYPS